MQYSFVKGLTKGLVSLVIFGLPFLITSFPEIANLTLGAIGVIFVNYLKVKFNQ